MTANKDLKRLVRSRMQKTGESYTAARAHVVKKPSLKTSKTLAAPGRSQYAAIAGMSDDAVKKATGCGWQRWVKALDHHGADTLSHTEIAKLIKTKYDTPSWWTQMVTVGYERIKGLRGRGQQRNGTFQMSKSKTFGVDVHTLFDAWADTATRKRWLGAGATVRSATAPKAMRIQVPDAGTAVLVFTAKGASKSSVAIEQLKLPDRAEAERLKTYWSEKLGALGNVFKE